MVEVVVCLVKIIVNNSCNNKNINVYAYICLGYLCIVAKKLVIVVVSEKIIDVEIRGGRRLTFHCLYFLYIQMFLMCISSVFKEIKMGIYVL